MSKKKILLTVLAIVASVAILGAATGEVSAHTTDYYHAHDEATDAEAAAGLAFLFGFWGVFACVGVLFYIYFGYSLMTIANKLKVENSWLSFVPIANIYIMVLCAGLEGTFALAYLAMLIPVLGGVIVMALNIYVWMKIAERRGFESWWGILTIVPLVNFIVPGYLAFSEPGSKAK